MSDAYEGLEGDFGFLIEATTVQPALTGLDSAVSYVASFDRFGSYAH